MLRPCPAWWAAGERPGWCSGRGTEPDLSPPDIPPCLHSGARGEVGAWHVLGPAQRRVGGRGRLSRGAVRRTATSPLPQGVEQDGLQVGRVDRGVRRAAGRVGDLLERTEVGVRAERDTDDLDRPIGVRLAAQRVQQLVEPDAPGVLVRPDRKSTRLNSSHANISYAVFCLKKKKTNNPHHTTTRADCD